MKKSLFFIIDVLVYPAKQWLVRWQEDYWAPGEGMDPNHKWKILDSSMESHHLYRRHAGLQRVTCWPLNDWLKAQPAQSCSLLEQHLIDLGATRVVKEWLSKFVHRTYFVLCQIKCSRVAVATSRDCICAVNIQTDLLERLSFEFGSFSLQSQSWAISC